MSVRLSRRGAISGSVVFTFAVLDDGSLVGEAGVSNVATVRDDTVSIETLLVPFGVLDEATSIETVGG